MYYLSLNMSTFPSNLLAVLKEMTTDPINVNISGPFPIYKPSELKIVIQAIALEAYSKASPERDFFKQQSDHYAEKEYLILHCWEDVWLKKPSLVISRLSALFGQARPVHGRQCVVKEIPRDNMNQFLDNHHLLGEATGKYKYGLFHRDSLVAVALFGRSVPIQRGEKTYQSYEMIRFCNQRNLYVQGGLSKFIQHFIKALKPEEIYTAVDRDWSDGRGYLTNGFRLVGTTDPMSFWLSADGHREKTCKEENSLELVNSGNLRLVLNLKND